MLVHRRGYPPSVCNRYPFILHLYSKVPCLRKQRGGRGLNPGPPTRSGVGGVNRSATHVSTRLFNKDPWLTNETKGGFICSKRYLPIEGIWFGKRLGDYIGIMQMPTNKYEVCSPMLSESSQSELDCRGTAPRNFVWANNLGICNSGPWTATWKRNYSLHQ